MIRKRKLAIVVAGVLLLAGVTLGLSTNNLDGLKSDIFGSGNSGSFICTPKAVAPGSRETKQYMANLNEFQRLQTRRGVLQSDTNVINNICKDLKGRARSQCQRDVAELRTIENRLDKLNVVINAYQNCKIEQYPRPTVVVDDKVANVTNNGGIATLGSFTVSYTVDKGYDVAVSAVPFQTLDTNARGKFSDIQITDSIKSYPCHYFDSAQSMIECDALEFDPIKPQGSKTFELKARLGPNSAIWDKYQIMLTGLGFNKGTIPNNPIIDPDKQIMNMEVTIPVVGTFKGTSWNCYDGFQGTSSVCQTLDEVRADAEKICKTHCSTESGKCGVNGMRTGAACEIQKPSIKSISPESGSVDTMIKIYGLGFNAHSTILIGDNITDLTPMDISPNGDWLTFPFPQTALTKSPADVYSIRVSNVGNVSMASGLASNSVLFRIVAPSVTYSWMVGPWSACLNGTQARSVTCQNNLGNSVADSYCVSTVKPAMTQSCSTVPTCTDSDSGKDYFKKGISSGLWYGYSNQFESHTDVCLSGKLYEYYCNQNSLEVQAEVTCINGCSEGACLPPPTLTHSWMIGPWSACLNGTQARSVTCQNNLGNSVADSYCNAGLKPINTQSCSTLVICTGTRPLNSTIKMDIGNSTLGLPWRHDANPVGPYQPCTFQCNSGTKYNTSMNICDTSPVTYAVNYIGNGQTGGISPVPQTKIPGTALIISNNIGALTRIGYTFAGWNTAADGSGTNYAPGASYTADVSVTFFAKWVPIPPPLVTYTITFDSQDATITATPSSKIVTTPATTVVTLPIVPVKTGFTFAGWYTAVNGGGTAFTATTPVTASTTVYAKWVPIVLE